MRVVTGPEMRDLDALAISKHKIPSIVLMENAGLRAAQIVAERHQELGYRTEILVFAGKGKNGGDALVVARQLLAMGKKVRVFLLAGFEDYKDESKQNLEILLQQKIRFVGVRAAADSQPLRRRLYTCMGALQVGEVGDPADGLLGLAPDGGLHLERVAMEVRVGPVFRPIGEEVGRIERRGLGDLENGLGHRKELGRRGESASGYAEVFVGLDA